MFIPWGTDNMILYQENQWNDVQPHREIISQPSDTWLGRILSKM